MTRSAQQLRRRGGVMLLPAAVSLLLLLALTRPSAGFHLMPAQPAASGAHRPRRGRLVRASAEPTGPWRPPFSLAGLGVLVGTLLAPLTLEPPTLPPSAPMLPVVHRLEALALSEEQELVVDVWREVTRQYVDGTFNGQGEDGWKKQRLDAVRALSDKGPGEAKEAAYAAIRTMLASLNDPYTRFLTPEQYEVLTSIARGASAGIGVQIQTEPDSGRVVVISTIRDGPAERAGLKPGDALIAVDGESTAGMTADLVAARCRGEPGTSLGLVVMRGEKNRVNVDVVRAAVKVSPVEASKLVVPDSGKSVALLKLTAFSQETVGQAVEALRGVTSGTDAIVIDLRGNAGGYMPAGVEMAKLFLPAQAKVIAEVARSGTATNYFSEGIGSETKEPLFLLVDKRTASASEIMAAALQDNKRATLVGPTRTFGKGRIQNVQQMEDGSGVAVTKAKYMTPKGNDIHGVGLTPDVLTDKCRPENDALQCVADLM